MLLYIQFTTNNTVAEVIQFLYPFLSALKSGDETRIQE